MWESFDRIIIIPTESYTTSFHEESRCIAVRSTSDFINNENETICYFNAAIQLLYYNIICRHFIPSINFYNMIYSLD